MKVNFNKYERVAGLFVLIAMVGTFTLTLFVALKQGLFESKIDLVTEFKQANGLSPGAVVQTSGLNIGSVDEVALEADKVVIHFHVLEKYLNRIRENSVAHTVRPFIIGDKVLEISGGDDSHKPVVSNFRIKSEETMDLMDLIGGRTLGTYLSSMGTLVENLRFIIESFADPERSKAFIGIFDQVHPLLKDLRQMSKEVTKLSRQLTTGENIEKTVANLVFTTEQMNQVLPDFVAIVKNSPELGKDVSQMIANLNQLTGEMTKLIPALSAVAPDLPRASRRAIEAMDEIVVVLKAMQKSFLLSGNAKEVREEEEKARKKAQDSKKEEERMPASE